MLATSTNQFFGHYIKADWVEIQKQQLNYAHKSLKISDILNEEIEEFRKLKSQLQNIKNITVKEIIQAFWNNGYIRLKIIDMEDKEHTISPLDMMDQIAMAREFVKNNSNKKQNKTKQNKANK